MALLYLGSTSEYSGKTLVAVSLALVLRQRGLKVGYFKHLGTLPLKFGVFWTDQDAAFAKDMLNLPEPMEKICPVVLTEVLRGRSYAGQVENSLDKIVVALEEISANKDLVIIEGAQTLQSGTFLKASGLDLVQRTKAKVVLVDKNLSDASLDYILWAKQVLSELFAGVILNWIRPARRSVLERSILPYLAREEVTIFGILPYQPLLGSASVEELRLALGAEVVSGREYLDKTVEHFMIGSMSVQKSLEYFRTASNKAVIVGGDRTDVLMAALETSTNCLILTGGLYPEITVIRRAEESEVPIIVVDGDTFSTVQKVEEMMGRTKANDERKVQAGVTLMEEDMDLSLLLEELGLQI